MIRHPNLKKWESTLKKLIDTLDDVLEDKYGDILALHPARRARGTTSNKAHDGLFDLSANFSLGLGSKTGKGYVIDIRLATLQTVPEALRAEIETTAIDHLRRKMPLYFPGTELTISKDGPVIKLHGDLSFSSKSGS